VHTHLRGESLTRDDLTDLALLRLDAVAAITVDATGHPGKLFIAHLMADGPADRPWRELPAESPSQPSTDFTELISGLEAESGRARRVAAVDAGKDRALMVHVGIGRARASTSSGEARVAELRELCRTAGVKVLDVLVQNRPEVDAKFLVGRGKL